MILDWSKSADFDGNGNTAHLARSGGPAVEIFRIEPAMQNDQVVYLIRTPRGAWPKTAPTTYKTLEAAKIACDQVEISLRQISLTPDDAIIGWAKDNKCCSFIEQKRIARWTERFYPTVPVEEVAKRLDNLLIDGKLKRSYVCQEYNGSIGMSSTDKDCWDDQSKIPAKLMNTGGDYFRRDDGDIIPVYRLPNNKTIASGVDAIFTEVPA